jgi:hypothetical protein
MHRPDRVDEKIGQLFEQMRRFAWRLARSGGSTPLQGITLWDILERAVHCERTCLLSSLTTSGEPDCRAPSLSSYRNYDLFDTMKRLVIGFRNYYSGLNREFCQCVNSYMDPVEFRDITRHNIIRRKRQIRQTLTWQHSSCPMELLPGTNRSEAVIMTMRCTLNESHIFETFSVNMVSEIWQET